jgi:hypothetical protein
MFGACRVPQSADMLASDLPELGVVRIASPCNQKWSQMTGDEQVRTCAACKLKVFNFAKLSSEEARQLIRRNSEGDRICARIFRRVDGTVLTSDCPRGFSRAWKVARRLLPKAGVALLVLVALFIGTVTLFGDNIRRMFGCSTMGALAGNDFPVDAPKQPRVMRLPNFGKPNAY